MKPKEERADLARQAKKLTVADILIGIVIIASALISVMLLPYADRRIAVIELDGSEYARYDLDEVAPFEEEIKTPYGYNRIQVSEQGVKVVSADCANKTDVKRGLISRSGESIICLPHRLVIYIEGADAETDSVSY